MSTMTSNMTNMTMPTTMATAAATATATMNEHMDMGGDDCKIAMLWNWYTVDACFVSHTWRITSAAMFAGSCIGIILLVLLLEFLRRASKEYDAYILRAHQQKFAMASPPMSSALSSTDAGDGRKGETILTRSFLRSSNSANKFRPSFLQQMVRAGFHTVAFAVGYFLMLLAMYYNGFIIMSIFIGAYLGFFIFGWESIELGSGLSVPADEATNCCG
ncbi:ctr copper transporter [Venturia nashicola]|uniref:Copper transport protein n=1 Tax=Venturia nashicola TaxID=86259 RepID=A0A4Z1NXZ3_9PEZI|nr:ctr copper transporter [Venturia nashicola]